jgi:hypothetical protein
LSVRETNHDDFFTCVRCARMLWHFGIPVYIPLPRGWHKLTPEQAVKTAMNMRKAGKKRTFTVPLRIA